METPLILYKRRKILHPRVNISESNKDPNLHCGQSSSKESSLNTSEDLSNTDIVVKHVDQVNNGNESSTKGSKIVMEESSLTNNEDLSNAEMEVNHVDQINNGKECLVEESDIVMKESELTNNDDISNGESEILKKDSNLTSNEDHMISISTELKMDSVDSVKKLDATEESRSQIRNEDSDLSSRKKLLVLDINGLLVNIVAEPDPAYKPDAIIGSKGVFKRPFCDEFIKFCFERFDVGVWTSRTRWNIERVLDFLIKETHHQLLFCWDQSHCTETGFNTIENSDKPLLLKELKKLWEKEDSNLPWDEGVYDESNTFLLDDSPYKALRNPPYTAIFPHSYSYRDTQDNGLGPEGDLRKYLEKLAESDNVQKFIEQNPFGQQPITYNSESWKFYLKVINATSSQPESNAATSLAAKQRFLQNKIKKGPFRSKKKLIIIDASGLLVDLVSCPREGFRPDTIQGPKSVFKRPYCDDFLNFCFKRFNVGIWTSTTRRNVERVFDFILKDTPHKFLFCWDKFYCTDTGFHTVENINKPLILKEIKNLWEKQDPTLPWRKGEYDESNTLLVENAPYKALLNPPHTAIFPYAYRYLKTEDNALGPEGELRVYLEKLAACDNVQKFVEQNSIGQRPITKKNLSWGFYQKVIRAFSSVPEPDINKSVAAKQNNLSEPKSNESVAAQHNNNPSEPQADNNNPVAATKCNDPSEPQADVNNSVVAQCLNSSEPKANVITALDGQSQPETDIITASSGQSQTILEPETNIITDSAGQSQPETHVVTASCGQSQPETGIITASSGQGQTVSEPLVNTTSASAGQSQSETLLETESDTSTASGGQSQTVLDPETDIITDSAGKSQPETDIITAPASQSQPEIDIVTALDGQSQRETNIVTAPASQSQTILEHGPRAATASSGQSQMISEQEVNTTSASGGQSQSQNQTISETE